MSVLTTECFDEANSGRPGYSAGTSSWLSPDRGQILARQAEFNDAGRSGLTTAVEPMRDLLADDVFAVGESHGEYATFDLADSGFKFCSLCANILTRS
jgi:hypothetical protein